MQEEPSRLWKASDFQHDPRFIGYEAGPRLCDLCNMGLVCRVGKQGRFVLFTLTNKGRAATSTKIAPSETSEHIGDEVQESPSDELPEFLGDDTVGELAGENYPKPSENVQQYRDGFIVL